MGKICKNQRSQISRQELFAASCFAGRQYDCLRQSNQPAVSGTKGVFTLLVIAKAHNDCDNILIIKYFTVTQIIGIITINKQNGSLFNMINNRII